ncbi:MAG: S-methyl-5-thioribose-1-phosphate isomerase [Syntrophales bacterium]|jgi:methylthioribose-1-phosphate isomerase|nr:S-methyl-5-thioribose-1-phosphate isomerase [Syntrophales bacterium]MDY0045640.1 S-methyl-5-thioribose-1-phosphate isomerase [Syntrophales bacterium]
MIIRPITWKAEGVVLIDQKALPGELRYVTCTHPDEILRAIENLTVRGAPAIGIAAALGIALGMVQVKDEHPGRFRHIFTLLCDKFSKTRPTAVNLSWAIKRMKRCFEENEYRSDCEHLKVCLKKEALTILEEDVLINRRIGKIGSCLISDNISILTHCNAGALATGGYGTALGVIRAAREEGKRMHVFACETRPVLQGARLTAWELFSEGIPATVITDNMAGFIMKQGKIDLVIVGADRIASNGDTANKIGTYTLAVLAKEHAIPFYVAAPLSTVDIGIDSGEDIPIEERNTDEVLAFQGIRTTPCGVGAYNPAFDVTPHQYITGIITESGIVYNPSKENVSALFEGTTK